MPSVRLALLLQVVHLAIFIQKGLTLNNPGPVVSQMRDPCTVVVHSSVGNLFIKVIRANFTKATIATIATMESSHCYYRYDEHFPLHIVTIATFITMATMDIYCTYCGLRHCFIEYMVNCCRMFYFPLLPLLQ